MIELQSNKKSGTPSHFYINPPFSGLSPLSIKKVRPPHKRLNFWKVQPTLPHPVPCSLIMEGGGGGGGGGFNYD